MITLLTVLCAIMIASIHIIGGRISAFGVIPRNVWLSLAGGASTSYVFLHILPDLQKHQEHFTRSMQPTTFYLETHVYILALLGMLFFYGLERLAKRSKVSSGHTSKRVFWIHMFSYGVYNLLFGYLLLHRERPGLLTLLFFTVAISLHFLVNDHALWEDHKYAYRNGGKWILSTAVLVGFALGWLLAFKQDIVSGLFAFLAGSILVNTLKEEIPPQRESRFWAFALGAVLYSILLLAS